MEYAVATGPEVVPWMSPTVSGGGGTVQITNQQLDSYAITTSQVCEAKCQVSGTPTNVVCVINGRSTTLTLDSSDNYYKGTVYGNFIGKCSAVSVLFLAGKLNDGDGAFAGSNITVTMSSVKVNPDPLQTIYNMLDSNWDPSETDDIKPEFRALVDEQDVHEYKGVKAMHFQDDGAFLYEIDEGESAVGMGYQHINRLDAVSIDMHCDGTREHFRKVINMIKHIVNANRNPPTTYPLTTDYPYDNAYLEGKGQEFSSKYSGHYRIIFTVNLVTYWEPIDT